MDRYKELNSEQQKFIQELKIQGTRSIDGWHSFFRRLAIFDKEGDLIRSSGCFLTVFFGIIIAFSIIFIQLLFLQGGRLSEYIIAAGAIVLSIVFLILTKRYFKPYENRDIPNPIRRFLVPLLELLQQQSAGQSEMKLSVDLKPMHDLFERKKIKNINRFNYLTVSVNLSDSRILDMTVGGYNDGNPDDDRLTHALDFSLTFDGSRYSLSGVEGDFEIIESQEDIILKNEYEEHSRDVVVDDPGLDFHRFDKTFITMQEAVKMK